MRMRAWVVGMALTLAVSLSVAQPLALDAPDVQRVSSVQLYRGSNVQVYPIAYLGEPADLTVEFDVLGSTTPEDLSYRLVHCDADWQPSRLAPIEYVDGFAYDRIQQTQPSRITRVPYVHYRASIPSQGSQFKVSGNYQLQVHLSSDETAVLFTRRFVVAERAVNVRAQLTESNDVDQRRRLQQLTFELSPGGLPLLDPTRELKVTALQNFQWGSAHHFDRPTYQYPDRLEYSFTPANDFPGGNEFRTLDLRSLRRPGVGVAELLGCLDTCDVRLEPERLRADLGYFSQSDFNGGFVTGVGPIDAGTGVEGDYVLARFELRSPRVERGEVYLVGAMSGWRLLPRFKLGFDEADEAYRGTILLKQGVYNYLFAVGHAGDERPDLTSLEGSHRETENDYALIVYYRRMGDRYDRAVGVLQLNTYQR